MDDQTYFAVTRQGMRYVQVSIVGKNRSLVDDQWVDDEVGGVLLQRTDEGLLITVSRIDEAWTGQVNVKVV